MKISWNGPFIVRLIYALCLLGASYNHVRQIVEHGLTWDYGGLPIFACTFWSALTFVDPLAVVLLLLTRRVGLALTVAIIMSDVLVNTWVGIFHGSESLAHNWMYMAQVSFLIFVGLTVRIAWQAKTRRRISDAITLEFPPVAKGRR